MSYSFSITAGSKAEATAKVDTALTDVVGAQPIHAADRQSVQDAANAFIGILTEPSEDESIYVSVSGSLGWSGDDVFISSSLNINACIGAKS